MAKKLLKPKRGKVENLSKLAVEDGALVFAYDTKATTSTVLVDIGDTRYDLAAGAAKKADNADALGGSSLQNIVDKINNSTGDGTAFTKLDTATNNKVKLTRANGGTVEKIINNVSNASTAEYTKNSDKLDGYHESSFLRYRETANTSTDSLWNQIGIKEFHNCYPENLDGVYNYGEVVSLPGAYTRFDIWVNHQSSNGKTNGLQYRSGWKDDKKPWRMLLDSGNFSQYAANKNAYNSASVSNAIITLGRSDGSVGTTLTVNNVAHAISADLAKNSNALGGSSLKDITDAINNNITSTTSKYLPLAGGNMTGNIGYAGSKATYSMIKFIDNKADTYGNGIAIGGGGLTIIGGGESSDTISAQYSSGGDESMVIANDRAIDFYTNCQNGFASAKHIIMNADGSVTASSFNGIASTAKIANLITDYNDSNKKISIGFAGNGLTTDTLGYLAGYTKDGLKVKDVSKDVASNWLGLDGYLKRYRLTNNITTGTTDLNGTMPPAIFAYKNGYPLHTDPEFKNGNNDIRVYNNSQNGNVTIERIALDNGNSSGYVLKISNKGSASPGLGGWSFSDATAYGKQFTCIFRAKIPSGRNVQFASNSIGTNGSQYWLTEHAGTGKWEWYAYRVDCGSANFSSTNFFYIDGAVGTASAPVVWYLSYANTIVNSYGNYDGLRTRYADTASNSANSSSAIFSTYSAYPQGFQSRTTSATWGNTTGTFITGWHTSSGGDVAFMNDNPSNGKVSMKLDGYFYQNEGSKRVLDTDDAANYVKKSGDTMAGTLTLKTGSQKGIKLGSAWLTAANDKNGEFVLQGGHLRFGSSDQDYNQWAGLKYDAGKKSIYLGLADNAIFTANSAQSGGSIFTPGVNNIYVGASTATKVLTSANIGDYASGKTAFTELDTTTNNVIKLTRANGATIQKTINNVANASTAEYAKNAGKLGGVEASKYAKKEDIPAIPSNLDVANRLQSFASAGNVANSLFYRYGVLSSSWSNFPVSSLPSTGIGANFQGKNTGVLHIAAGSSYHDLAFTAGAKDNQGILYAGTGRNPAYILDTENYKTKGNVFNSLTANTSFTAKVNVTIDGGSY